MSRCFQRPQKKMPSAWSGRPDEVFVLLPQVQRHRLRDKREGKGAEKEIEAFHEHPKFY